MHDSRASVVIPISQEPQVEAIAIFLAVLAFPSVSNEDRDERNREKYTQAYCREAIRRLARVEAEFAWTPQPLKPGYFLMSDAEAEKVLAAGNKQLIRRRQAFVAIHTVFEEALRGVELYKGWEGFGTRLGHDAESRYVLTNTWLGKGKDASTKPLIRDVISPARPVIHAVYALWSVIFVLLKQKCARDEFEAFELVVRNKANFSAVIRLAERCRIAAIKHPSLRVTEADLIKFVEA